VVADGRFELLGLPAGKYRLYLSRIGDGARVEGGKEIEVLAGRPLEVELRATVVGADGR
jgi:hypothetical protein